MPGVVRLVNALSRAHVMGGLVHSPTYNIAIHTLLCRTLCVAPPDCITLQAIAKKKPFYVNAWFHVSHAVLAPTEEQLEV